MIVDFKNTKFNDGDFQRSKDYSDLIEESGRQTFESWITFSFEDGENFITVEFIHEIEGYWTYCPGDYWTPPDSDFDLTDDVVHIVGVQINEIDVEMIPELDDILTKMVYDEINL